jgi:ClpP class serine protease
MWLADQSALAPMIHKAIDGEDHDVDPEKPDCLNPIYTVEDGVAVILIRGVIVRECSAIEAQWFGLCSSSRISEAIEAAEADPAISGILLDIDSPGGECCGTPECADVVAACRKPVAAWSGGLMASAAYWIGSHSKYVTASRSASVGSIG